MQQSTPTEPVVPATKKRYCFYVSPTSYDANGYIPSVVYENERGHAPLVGEGDGAAPWYWGKTLEEAEEVCRQHNLKLGLDDEAVMDIIASSMRAQNMPI